MIIIFISKKIEIKNITYNIKINLNKMNFIKFFIFRFLI